MEKPIIAILYDFDKTLSTTDMQNYSLIPELGLTPDEFWSRCSEFTKKNGVERILSYMYVMIDEAKKKGIKITRKFLNDCGKNIVFFPGVEEWFKRINKYANEKGLIIEHYLVSSGTKEIVEGCSIFPQFTQIYGCEYFYDEKGEAKWPKLAINFTQKTQYFFRIAKGAIDPSDDAGVNQKSRKLRIPHRNIIYLGDGMTDIACMTLVKQNGGNSITIYSEGEKERAEQIYKDGRCSFIAPANYRPGTPVDTYIKLLIDKISVLEAIDRKVEKLNLTK